MQRKYNGIMEFTRVFMVHECSHSYFQASTINTSDVIKSLHHQSPDETKNDSNQIKIHRTTVQMAMEELIGQAYLCCRQHLSMM